MMDAIKQQVSSTKLLVTLLILAVGLYLFQNVWAFLGNFSDVFIIMISAWLISFILEPPVDYLTRMLHIKKIFAATIVYLIFIGIITTFIIYFIPTITSQVEAIVTFLPKYVGSAASSTFSNKLLDFVTGNISNSLVVIPSVANFLLYFILTIIISFYLIVDKETILRELYNLAPTSWHKEMRLVQDVIESTFASFLRVQLVFGVLSGVTTWIVLMIFHVEFALTAAIVAGLLTIVPLLGPALALIPPVVVCLLFASSVIIPVLLLLLIAEQIIFNVIGPKLLGNAFNLHPIIVLLSFVVGFKLAGNIGALLAIPVLGILVVVAHRLWKHLMHTESVK